MSNQMKTFFIDVLSQICKKDDLFAKRSAEESKFNWCKSKIYLSYSFPVQLKQMINFYLIFETKNLTLLEFGQGYFAIV